MDASALVQAFTPSKILIKTSCLPNIFVNPAAKSWLGDLLDPQIYVYEGDLIIKIDPGSGSAGLVQQSDVDALGNGWGNFLFWLGLVVFGAVIIKQLIKGRMNE